jgi:hypothetical protein
VKWGSSNLGEERVEAVHFLPLLDEGVVLRNTLQGEFFHEIDLVGLPKESFLEVLDGDGECGREEQDLLFVWHEVDYLLHERLELGRQQLVRLRTKLISRLAQRRSMRFGGGGGGITSSMTMKEHLLRSATFFLARSSTRPGVATRM